MANKGVRSHVVTDDRMLRTGGFRLRLLRALAGLVPREEKRQELVIAEEARVPQGLASDHPTS